MLDLRRIRIGIEVSGAANCYEGLRVRLGWKIKGDKFDELGDFGALVFTINPFDTYGDD